MTRRKNPSHNMKKILLRKNKGVCCVCKESGLGLEFHHIDGNPLNTKEENIAVLCAKDHDNYHRPNSYSKVRHLDLSSDQIRRYKESWESFVEEASKPNTNILGFLVVYGVDEVASALRITFQWESQVMYEKLIHVTESPPQAWIDQVIEIRNWLGEYIWINVVPEILPIDFCKKCVNDGRGYNRRDPRIYGSVAKKYTDPTWGTDSLASIYIDSHKPFLSFGVVSNDEFIHAVFVYKQGKRIHVSCSEPLCKCHSSSNDEGCSQENLEEYIVRHGSNELDTFMLVLRKHCQARSALFEPCLSLINSLLRKWEPAKCNIFTFINNAPVLLDGITFHEAWFKDSESNLSDLVQSVRNAYCPKNEKDQGVFLFEECPSLLK
ncbi:MAG TPA: HNH endonuclease signature motif containing protein [Ktedonobacteraceae bacterium]|nr:HNH endonuclease signature motif containing protein [Ktedonobacteraceae bacterium]